MGGRRQLGGSERPHGVQRIAPVQRRRSPLHHGLAPPAGKTEVRRDDGAVLLVSGIEPAADRLARKAAVGEGANEWSAGADYSRSEERRVGKECRSRWSP